jgi:hypothetical protein
MYHSIVSQREPRFGKMLFEPSLGPNEAPGGALSCFTEGRRGGIVASKGRFMDI